mmetsp:Transcript_7254/g.10686  ORF Transcript_7254/g.10686 Transcript_7254/m.10686 type:complete len:215 (+) Transcript_7254:168-812(+)
MHIPTQRDQTDHPIELECAYESFPPSIGRCAERTRKTQAPRATWTWHRPAPSSLHLKTTTSQQPTRPISPHCANNAKTCAHWQKISWAQFSERPSERHQTPSPHWTSCRDCRNTNTQSHHAHPPYPSKPYACDDENHHTATTSMASFHHQHHYDSSHDRNWYAVCACLHFALAQRQLELRRSRYDRTHRVYPPQMIQRAANGCTPYSLLAPHWY